MLIYWCILFIPAGRYIVINVVKPISDNFFFMNKLLKFRYISFFIKATD